ncbi:MAG: SDR family oxidoreductase [Tepidisphaeraceae bacterium]
MNIVIFGGSGLIGTGLAARLREAGHHVSAVSSRTGVNAVTGEGVAAAVAGAEVVVDVLNSPSFEDHAVLSFFEAASRNMLAAARSAGVRHYVALSVVGTHRLQQSGYFRAKLVQETLIAAAGVPYTIVRATQFFEFLPAIADFGTADGVVHAPAALLQPIAARDVAGHLARVVTSAPANGIVDLAGPERVGIDAAVRQVLQARADSRLVLADPSATYFGTPLENDSLVPTGPATLAPTKLADWLKTNV